MSFAHQGPLSVEASVIAAIETAESLKSRGRAYISLDEFALPRFQEKFGNVRGLNQVEYSRRESESDNMPKISRNYSGAK